MARRSGTVPRRAPVRPAKPPTSPAPPPNAPIAESTPLPRAAGVAVAAALTFAWLLLFFPVLDGHATFVRGDAGRYTAFAEFSRARFETAGERTFWNPYVFLGLPTAGSLADPRPQWLPDPLLHAWDALTRTTAGTPLWLPLLACLAGALGGAWLARALWSCGPFAMALAGGLWLTAPGLLVPLAFGHDAQAVSASLTPLVLLTAYRLLLADGPRGVLVRSLAFAGALAAQVLGGHPQFVAYSGLVLVPFALERARAHGRLERLWALAAAGGLGAAMSAGAWLPALRFGAHAQRLEPGFGAREAAIWSLLPRDLLSLAWPEAVGYEGAAYWGGMRGTDFSHVLGLLAVGLAVHGLLCRAPARRAARLWGGVALAAMLFSLGRNLPVLGSVLQALPLIGTFRTPMTWLTLAVLAAALLAARGLDDVLRGERRAWWPRAAIACVALAGVLFILPGPLAEAWLAASRPAVEDRIARGLVGAAAFERFAAAAPPAAAAAAGDLALQFLLLGAALGALDGSRRGNARWRAAALSASIVLAAIVPCARLVLPALRAATGPRESLRTQPPPPLARAAAADPRHRAAWFEREWALSQRWSLSDDWVAWRAPQVVGLSGAVPARWDLAARSGLFASRAFLRACAVRTVAMPAGDTGDTVGAWPDALPRAYSVRRVHAVADDAGAVAAMREPAWDPALDAIVVATGDRSFANADSIEWVRDEPDHLSLRVLAAGTAFVVIADAGFPGWTTRVDGRRVPIEPVDLLFRGVQLPSGSHRVELDYEPEGWAAGRAVALTGFACALGALAWVALLRISAVRPRASSAAPSGGAR
jgi:hypothetical protein